MEFEEAFWQGGLARFLRQHETTGEEVSNDPGVVQSVMSSSAQ
jgi:hypothetical protein